MRRKVVPRRLSEINIAIGEKAPEQYFGELAEQCAGGKKRYGNIIGPGELHTNLRMNCLPESLLDVMHAALMQMVDRRIADNDETAKKEGRKPSPVFPPLKTRLARSIDMRGTCK